MEKNAVTEIRQMNKNDVNAIAKMIETMKESDVFSFRGKEMFQHELIELIKKHADLVNEVAIIDALLIQSIAILIWCHPHFNTGIQDYFIRIDQIVNKLFEQLHLIDFDQ